ncbi:MAG: hypothetical protein WBO46_19625 [Caldilineaceae bacterium]
MPFPKHKDERKDERKDEWVRANNWHGMHCHGWLAALPIASGKSVLGRSKKINPRSGDNFPERLGLFQINLGNLFVGKALPVTRHS